MKQTIDMKKQTIYTFTHKWDISDSQNCVDLTDETEVPGVGLLDLFPPSQNQESEQMEGNAKREGSIQSVMKVCSNVEGAREQEGS